MKERFQWVSRSEELASLVASVGEGPVGLDSEADSLHHYPEKVCLIQLSIRGSHYLLDPLCGLDLEPLGPLLREPGVMKILHGADYDLRVLHRDFGFEIRGLFDTMVAARLVGEEAVGLAALLGKRFDVTLDKKYQRADWSKRPLPEAMASYAVMDTCYLESLANELGADLERLGRRQWAEEEYLRLEQVRWNEPPDGEAFRRLKGSGKLHRRGLAVLRELYRLREEKARQRNRPPFMILRNETLLSLAAKPPETEAAIAGFPGIPRPWSRGKQAGELLAALRRAIDLPADELPESRPVHRARREGPFEAKVKSLSRERNAVAAQLGLEPSVVATRAALEQIVDLGARGEDLEKAPDLRAWQAQLLRPALERAEG